MSHPILQLFRFTLILVFTGLALWLNAQEHVTEESPFTTRQWYAQNSIAHMKGSMVLVRLKTDYNNIRQLQDMLQDTMLSDRDRRTVEMSIMQKQHNVQFVNNTLVRGFTTSFNFVKEVYFFYDTSSTAIRQGEFSGHVYDLNLELVDFVPPDDGFIPYYVIMSTVYNNTHGIAVHDHHFNMIPWPFPGFVSMWFEEPQLLQRAFHILYRGRYFPVERLNRKLLRYYTKSAQNQPSAPPGSGSNSTP